MAKTIMQRGYKIVRNGTDDHLMLIDLIDKKITGKDAEAALGQAYITTNKNAVPNDPQSPFVTSGIRIGTPALTTRGMKEGEMRQVGKWISEVLHNRTDKAVLARIRREVLGLAEAFPLYATRRAKHAEAVKA